MKVMHKFGAPIPWSAQIGKNGNQAVVIQNEDYGRFMKSERQINTMQR